MKTIQTIQNYIDEKQIAFSQHEFFSYLENCASIEDFLATASDLAFWVMAFQDVLRLNETRIKDRYLHMLARHHRIEDKGHEEWFLQDVAQFENNKNDINVLFDKKNTTTRDAAYAIVAEVFNLNDEHLRVILLLTLESSGHIFFAQAAKFVENKGYSQRLKYFSNHHLEVEKAHAIFEESMEKKFLETALSLEKYSAALALVDRMYDAFYLMFDGLVSQLQQGNKISSNPTEQVINLN